jgi:predicted phage terminase large subunit-like protein
MTPEQAASILLSRRQCRRDLVEYARRIPIPGAPRLDKPDEAIPLIETQIAEHHELILRELQRTMETEHGRLMIFAPPGSAKSTMASVVGPSWYLGRKPGARVIMASYGSDLAKRQGRRVRQILSEPETQAIHQCGLDPTRSAADDFALTNRSEYIAIGMLGGVTGNRANGIIIDDPVSGREDAESKTIRDKTWAAYQDDLLTRLIPGGWVTIILTRWHQDDLAGRILPEAWSGESGDILCRDGNVWRVVCLQAEATQPTDPLKRAPGQMLWPQWFTPGHWAQFRGNARTWSSLYQQLPAPAEGILFRASDMATYDQAPLGLRIIGASDYAVTPDGGDWTEHGIAGIAPDGSLYLLDWWRGQTGPEEWIERKIDMIIRHKPLAWFGETGPIRRATEGSIKARMTERHAPCRIEWLPHIGDKPTKAQAVIAVAGMGRLLWPRNAAWVPELQRQCLVFPAGRPDDGVDTLGMLGRGAASLGSAPAEQSPAQIHSLISQASAASARW